MAMYRMGGGHNPVAVAVAGAMIGVGLLIAFRRQRSG
jgi:LPXTG-motif cell wall-anchored protein